MAFVGIVNPIPNMETLTCKKSFFELVPRVFPSVFLSPLTNKNRIFLRIHHRKQLNSFNTLRFSSAAYHHSLTYSGWDDLLENGGSTIHSGESNLLDNVLNSLGISGRKYVFVYLFGFVCALAISRVKVSTIAVFPACAVVFAIGFSVGLVKAGQLKESKLDGHRRELMEETYNCFIEKLRNLVDSLNGYNAKIVNLKNDIRRRIECNQVTVSVLEGYLDVIESSDTAFVNVVDVVESCIQSILRGDKIKEVNSCPELSTRKKYGENGFKFSQIFGGLFGGNPVGLKTDKLEELGYGEVVDGKVNNRKEANILSASIKERNLNSIMNGKQEDKTARIVSNHFDETVRSQNNDEDYVVGSGVRNEVFEHQKKKLPDKNGTTKSVFNQTDCSNKSRLVNDKQVYLKDYDREAMSLRHNSYNSEDFIISMKHKETARLFDHRQKLETRDINYWQSESTDEGRTEFWNSFKGDTSRPQKQLSFTSEEPAHMNALGSAPSSIADDLEFGRYLSEANNLFKEAKGCLRHQVDLDCSENALYKAALLLSKAIEIRPMSLLALEKLGNTYLLHGELKLWISRKLRSQLARKYPFSIEEGMKVPTGFDDPLAGKEKMKLTLVDVCEECEELLIKAGRKYKLALSIDGNAMRALYNWGLSLSFRAQLIADIGPIAARDADQVFMAATDKFEALMSRSNDYAPDALLKWGAALQDRSRLRPGRSREKVKLLQQARCLYEDALHMDSGNLRLQEALSSCVSELDHWYS